MNNRACLIWKSLTPITNTTLLKIIWSKTILENLIKIKPWLSKPLTLNNSHKIYLQKINKNIWV